MSVIDLEYKEFVQRIGEYPPEVLAGLVNAMEDRLKGLEAAIAATKQCGDKAAEIRLLMAFAWNARKLAALKAAIAEKGVVG